MKRYRNARLTALLSRYHLSFSIQTILFSLLIFGVEGCDDAADRADIYGDFEAVEISVSSELLGRIIQLDVEEGQVLKSGEVVGLIDTMAMHLKMNTVEASIAALKAKLQRVAPAVAALVVQRDYLFGEIKRLENLVESGAAPAKKLDELKANHKKVEAQIKAVKFKISDANKALLAGLKPLRAQWEELNYQRLKARIVNPVAGTVLAVYHRSGEVAAPLQPLYKIANLREIFLRGYISEGQLSTVRIGKEVEVDIAVGRDSIQQRKGVVTWISDRAEFTPRTIQTKEERINKVYAIKVKVPNENGHLKIGMPGEIQLK